MKASREAGLTGDGVFSRAPLDLRFAMQKTLDPRISFTRASNGTFVGSDGLIKTATTNEPRFTHNPTTGESLGLLVEEPRTNLLLNSATLSTQSVTVAAAANTLSFYGTGTVALTGVSTAGPLVGTGANNRVSLTFTPTVGVLVLTVSGLVTNAQLEVGAFATSYIPTTSATVTRAADVASITGAAFSSFYNQAEGTIFIDGSTAAFTATTGFVAINNAASTNRLEIRQGRINPTVTGASTSVTWTTLSSPTLIANTSYKQAVAFSNASHGNSIAGVLTNTSSTEIPAIAATQLLFGIRDSQTAPIAGSSSTIKRFAYWPVRLANTTLQAISQL